jgi:lipopolysaccharide/colanic/teichoic acid biosynthesis glycosyltransferase
MGPFYRRFAKRPVDLILAGAFLLVSFPLLLLIAAAIKLESQGPVLFRQTRIGRHLRPFQILKFRTMRPAPAQTLITAAADPRITRVGRILRQTKLDELPQLWNIVRGHMSLVGPRPEVEKYVSQGYSAADKAAIFAIRPGLTDPMSLELYAEEQLLQAQPDIEKFYLDVLLPRKIHAYRRYVDSLSLVGDLQIVVATLRTVAVSMANLTGTSSKSS